MQTDPQAVTAKWLRNIQAANQSIIDGVNNVQQAPGAKAGANVQLWLQRIQASAPKWQARVSATTLQQWQQAMLTKGVPRISTGAQANQDKVQAFMTQLLPYIANARQQVLAMPKGDLASGIARATAMITAMSKFSYKKG